MLSSLMGWMNDVENDEQKSTLLTRAKARLLDQKGQIGWPVSALEAPVQVKVRTFLNVDYSEHDEEDRDYNPLEDPLVEEGEEEEGGGGEGEEQVVHETRSRRNLEKVAIESIEKQLRTSGDDEDDVWMGTNRPLVLADDNNTRLAQQHKEQGEGGDEAAIYENFLLGLFDEEDTQTDPEYNYMADFENNAKWDHDDVRFDRATKIPRREVRDLLKDLFDLTEEEEREEEEEKEEEGMGEVAGKEQQLEVGERRYLLVGNAGQEEEGQQVEIVGQTSIQGDSSCLLDEEQRMPRLLDHERKQLITQLRQHVQLLSQLHLISRECDDDSLKQQANETRLMLDELLEYKEKAGEIKGLFFDEASLFAVDTLSYAMNTVNTPSVSESGLLKSFFRIPTGRSSTSLHKTVKSIRPSVILQLAMSRASVYPELLPLAAPTPSHSTPAFRPFYPSETNLLALGLCQFRLLNGGVRRHSFGEGFVFDLRRYLLPARTERQIRAHLKANKRKAGLNFIKLVYSTGNMPYLGSREGVESEENCCSDSLMPIEWSDEVKPLWLKRASRYLKGQCWSKNRPVTKKKKYKRRGHSRYIVDKSERPVVGSSLLKMMFGKRLEGKEQATDSFIRAYCEIAESCRQRGLLDLD